MTGCRDPCSCALPGGRPTLWGSKRVMGCGVEDHLASLASLPGGGFLAAGLTRSLGAGSGDAWLARFDDSANLRDDCGFVPESNAVSIMTTPVVLDTDAEVIATNVAFIPTDGIRSTIDLANELICFAPSLAIDADIKPGSCPNPLNVNRRGVIPAALTTFDPADASLIDPASVQLEGVPALRCTIDDVSAPWDDATACCGTPGPDGLADVMCHFDSQAVAGALCARRAPPPADGDVIDLELTALTFDGAALRASDCVRIQTFDCSTIPSPPGRRHSSRPPRAPGR